jgi:hypothetical protein
VVGTPVGVYNTQHQALREIDFMLETARSLVNNAVDALVRLHHIDRRTAHDWIREASD